MRFARASPTAQKRRAGKEKSGCGPACGLSPSRSVSRPVPSLVASPLLWHRNRESPLAYSSEPITNALSEENGRAACEEGTHGCQDPGGGGPSADHFLSRDRRLFPFVPAPDFRARKYTAQKRLTELDLASVGRIVLDFSRQPVFGAEVRR